MSAQSLMSCGMSQKCIADANALGIDLFKLLALVQQYLPQIPNAIQVIEELLTELTDPNKNLFAKIAAVIAFGEKYGPVVMALVKAVVALVTVS